MYDHLLVHAERRQLHQCRALAGRMLDRCPQTEHLAIPRQVAPVAPQVRQVRRWTTWAIGIGVALAGAVLGMQVGLAWVLR